MRRGVRKDFAAFTFALPVMTWLKGAPDKVLFRAATPPPPGKAYARKRRAHWLQNTWHTDSRALRRLLNSTVLVTRQFSCRALVGPRRWRLASSTGRWARQTCLDLGRRGSSHTTAANTQQRASRHREDKESKRRDVDG